MRLLLGPAQQQRAPKKIVTVDQVTETKTYNIPLRMEHQKQTRTNTVLNLCTL